MRLAWLAVLAAAVAAAPAPRKTPSPAEAVAALVGVAAPAGWTRSAYSNAGGADPVVAFERGADRLVVRVFGAPGSFYATPADFLKGPAATTLGRRPDRAGSARVSGRRVRVWRRSFPLDDEDPHTPYLRRRRMGGEYFCVLPPAPDGRFVVLSWQRSGPGFDPSHAGKRAWEAFLKTVVLRAVRRS
ncbi:MAG: hypothetical protein KGM24_08545 [Elusimicrobia bacterium]|nr:hypothetical protein [Elusimicrobiota bacterium]